MKKEVQAWGGRVESTFFQLRANDAQNEEALGGLAEGLRKELGKALRAQRGELEASQRVLLGRVEALAKGTPQEVASLVGGVKHGVGELRQDMSSIFPIVTGLHQLASAQKGEAEALRREFQKGFAEGAKDVAAWRVDMGKTVGLLIGAVKADRLQTKKLCQAVFNLQKLGEG